jgi:hypothetical protein
MVGSADEAAMVSDMAGFMFKILFPGADGAAPVTHYAMTVGRDEAAARARLDDFMNLLGEEKVTSLPLSDELIAFMELRDGDARLWKH